MALGALDPQWVRERLASLSLALATLRRPDVKVVRAE
jgi:hypothetical protein